MKVNYANILKMFEEKVAEAEKNPAIHKPYAWALYHTWKAVDANEKDRLLLQDARRFLKDEQKTF